jgi:hypothetical protein
MDATENRKSEVCSQHAVLINRSGEEVLLFGVTSLELDEYISLHEEDSDIRFQLVDGVLSVFRVSLLHETLAGLICDGISFTLIRDMAILGLPMPRIQTHTGRNISL